MYHPVKITQEFLERHVEALQTEAEGIDCAF